MFRVQRVAWFLPCALLVLSWLVAPAEPADAAGKNEPAASSAEPHAQLPPAVVAAIAEGDCERMMRLNRQYWQRVSVDQPPADVVAAAQLLEAHILADPLCGRAEGELLQVVPLSGIDFFDHRGPLGRNTERPR